MNGREFVGRIVASEVEETCDLKPGEWVTFFTCSGFPRLANRFKVLAVSTDYRDFRKAAFQEFAIVCCYNAIRIPPQVDKFRVASIGVAFVAAGLALSACLGISFTKGKHNRSFNLLEIAQRDIKQMPEDVLPEIQPGISPSSRPYPGEWILVYGGKFDVCSVLLQRLTKR